MNAIQAYERDALKQYLPELFSQAGTMLYVGAGAFREAYHVRTFSAAGWTVDLLEVYGPNVAHYAESDLFRTVWHGDVRTFEAPQAYDVVFWWHGPEHIHHEELAATLQRLERMAPLIILACPHGHFEQGAMYGNEAERHLWTVEPADLAQYGYETLAIQPPNRRSILAWKRTVSPS